MLMSKLKFVLKSISRLYYTTSSKSATPARIHLAGGAFVLSWALKTYVGPLCSVLYTGHMYTP